MHTVSLVDLISSQLLLYRMTVTFAAPPSTVTDLYKSDWTFVLWNCEDPICCLEISDNKGWPTASFTGREKANAEALQLLDWLIGNNCVHSYDYTLCGRHA